MQHLPQELKDFINNLSSIYGKAIKEIFNKKIFLKVEQIRKQMKKGRPLDDKDLYAFLQKSFSQLKKMDFSDIHSLAHILSIYLEIINRAEASYRHHRLKSRQEITTYEKAPYALHFVFTAHPTEARDFRSINILKMVDKTLQDMLSTPHQERIEKNLRHLFKLLLKSSFSKEVAPKVEDEAHYICSQVLDNELLLEQIHLYQSGIYIQFRSWAGGDKDGNPYVNKDVMLKALQISRQFLMKFMVKELKLSKKLLKNLRSTKQNIQILNQHDELLIFLHSLKKIISGDGKKIHNLHKSVQKIFISYINIWGELNKHLENIKGLIKLYPALVLPLELREDADLINPKSHEKSESQKIHGMLATLKEVSTGSSPKYYVRSLILSMVQTTEDILNGIKVIKKHFKKHALPVVPLFETKSALLNADKILNKLFKETPSVYQTHQKNWNGNFEVMLGYSDSAKENGTLASRFLIASTLNTLDQTMSSYDLRPVFFHGSGGSIERGGGSIQGQIKWWPRSALNIFKSTIQGEMVYRNFGDPLIMSSIVQKICSEFSQRKKRTVENFPTSFQYFVDQINHTYSSYIKDPEFKKLTISATPYSFLNELKIGSRPTKRKTNKKTDNYQDFKLRAIPWVLCWTQTRVLFPSWWGIGHVWNLLSQKQKREIKTFYKKSHFFQSFMKVLGLTLAKIEISVFHLYLEENLDKNLSQEIFQKFSQELKKTTIFFQDITGQKNFLWFRPWLQESIYYRSPMIHPLNLMQLMAIQKRDSKLLRKTITGISSGMMTTG